MNSNAFCPISNKQIDENTARLNATVVSLLIISAIITQWFIIDALLLVDFTLRGIEFSKYSPIANLSGFITKILNLKRKPVNAGPKIFAARIGIVFSFFALIFNITGLESTSNVVLIIFGACAILEAVFAFCVACQIYPFIYKFTYTSK